jgi:hypothetical protein
MTKQNRDRRDRAVFGWLGKNSSGRKTRQFLQEIS